MANARHRHFNLVGSRGPWAWWYAPVLGFIVPIIASGLLWLSRYRDIVAASHDPRAVIDLSLYVSCAALALIIGITVFLVKTVRQMAHLYASFFFVTAIVTLIVFHPSFEMTCSQVGIDSIITGFVGNYILEKATDSWHKERDRLALFRLRFRTRWSAPGSKH